MAILVRDHEWAATPLGPRDAWPAPLHTLATLVLDTAQPMFVAWGPHRTLIYNDPFADILAARHPAALGADLLDTWPGPRDPIVEAVARAHAGVPVRLTNIPVCMPGEGHPDVAVFSVTVTPARATDGSVAGLLCTWTEVTAQIQSDRRRQEGETRLHSILEGMGEGFMILDHAFRVLEINREGLRIDGRRRDEIVGRHLLEAWPNLADPPTWETYRRAMTGRTQVDLVQQHRTPTGDLWLEVRAYPVDAGLAVFSRDVTVRHQVLEAAHAAAERLDLALTAGAIAGTWLWLLDPDVFTADERFAHSFGLDPDRCRAGLPVEDVLASIHPDHLDRVQTAIAAALRQGGPYRCEYPVRQHDGVFRWVEAIGRVELNTDGGPARFPGVLIDIEDRRAIEAERDHATDLLRTIVAAVPGVVYVKDRAGRMLVANQGTTDLIGRPPEDYIGRTDLEFLANPDEAAAVMATDRRIMETGEAEQIEEEVRLADGSPAIWLSNKTPLRDPSGRVIGLIGASVDITARKRAEAALAANEARLRSVLDNVPVGVILAEAPYGRINFWNAAVEQIFRHPVILSETVEDDREWRAFHEDGRRVEPQEYPLARVLATGQTADSEYLYACGDGVMRWVQVVGAPVLDSEGRLTGALIVCTDVDERNRAGSALRTALDSIPQIVWSSGPDGLYDFCNRRWYDLTGSTPDQALGTGWIDLVHPDDRDRTVARWHQALATGQPYDAQFRKRLANGLYTWVLSRALPLRPGPDAPVERWYGTCTEIDDLVAARSALATALNIKETLLAEVNHRVKNSLQLVSSLLTLQATRSTDSALRAALAEARGRIGVVAQVHRRLYQAGTHGRIDDLSTFILELCQDALAALGPAGGNIRLETSVPRWPISTPIDSAVPLALIVFELMTNAVKYAYPAGTGGIVGLDIDVPETGGLHIRFADHGVGLPGTFDSAQSRSVGMRVVHTLVRQLRGTMTVGQTDPSGGAAFTLAIPPWPEPVTPPDQTGPGMET